MIELSPNMRIFGRRTRTPLPTAEDKLRPQMVESNNVKQKLGQRMLHEKLYYDTVPVPTEAK